MKNKFWGFFLAIMIIIIGYIMVSSAAKQIQLDIEENIQWKYEHAIK